MSLWMLSRVKPQGLVDALDLALGLRVVWIGIFLQDSRVGKLVFKWISTVTKPFREDPAFTCRGRLWWLEFKNSLHKWIDQVFAGDGDVGLTTQ